MDKLKKFINTPTGPQNLFLFGILGAVLMRTIRLMGFSYNIYWTILGGGIYAIILSILSYKRLIDFTSRKMAYIVLALFYIIFILLYLFRDESGIVLIVALSFMCLLFPILAIPSKRKKIIYGQ